MEREGFVNVGKIIKEKREEKRMLQKELAELVGCGTPLICKWENNKLRPSIEQLKVVERVLQLGIFTKDFMNQMEGNN